KKQFCAIGSIKSNIGHLDAAAGIAGFIKTVLMLKHKKLPASLHFENPNPNIHFEDTPFYVIDNFADWTSGPTPRLAGVSSFGVGGTNAHVILEEAPVMAESDLTEKWRLLTLSAKTQSALDAATRNLASHIRQQDDLNLADVAYTLHVGREPFRFRRAVVCKDRADALEALETTGPERFLTAVSESACFLNSLARLWLAGEDVKWDQLYRNEHRMRVPLPTYPFEGKRYWIETVPSVFTPESSTSPDISADSVEQVVAEIWQNLLGIEKIGRDDKFFELGGDSLSASQVVSRIREIFHVEIPLDIFFEDASMSALVNFVRKSRLEEAQANGADSRFSSDPDFMQIQPVLREGGVCVSFSQERMWFLSRLDPENFAYNLSGGYRFKGWIRVDILERCLTEIVRRHEMMRSIFRDMDGKLVQVVLPPFAFPLPVVDLQEVSVSEREQMAQRLSGEEARRPFDLSTGPFFRAVLLRLSEDDHILVLTMHHIITDGWSFDVFVRELEVLYKAFSEG
ncbi:MAG: condensation domain-containing protein, partial [Saprospiraceae bacterium]|nr:condensation domain-containing protein [Saprospiraceae bacterium]